MAAKSDPPYLESRVPPRSPGCLRVVTWNINSVRLRLELLGRLAKACDADVICLQETKATNDVFPAQAIAKLGYAHQHFQGDKGYNGVAILSRLPLLRPGRKLWAGREDSRHVEAVIGDDIELHCVYVPAGGDIPDPKQNPKFAHKLEFLEHLAESWLDRRKDAKRMLVGDLNVAPLENDVWSHRQLLDVVSHTPAEVERFTRAIAAHGWTDAVRAAHPEPRRLYTWWSYRNRDWRMSDRGRRLDHVWVSPALAGRVRGTYILKGARDWPQGSDHVPVIADLARA
jgi:exodeoxyribonuclease-3